MSISTNPDRSNPTPELVVFDLGRVLLRIADDWAHCAALSGVPLPASLGGDISASHTRNHDQADPELEAAFGEFERGRTTSDAFFTFAGPRLSLSIADARQLFDGWLIEPMPGLDALLDEIDAAKAANPGLRTACLSNTNAAHWEHITGETDHPAAMPVHRLDYPLASQLLGEAKPDATCYAEFERRTDTQGQAILFLDDLPANVEAAKARGWHSVLVPRMDDAIPFVREQLRAFGVLQG
ncbi:MAG: HAD-IA family hydrolase [Planctomycetota bacterium]